jgi:hypothetical protein
MVEPVTMSAVIGGFAGLLGGILKLAEHPVIAWLLVVLILLGDAGLVGGLTFVKNGVVGSFASFIVGFFLKGFQVSSFQLMVIVIIFPVIIFVLGKSRQLQNR